MSHFTILTLLHLGAFIIIYVCSEPTVTPVFQQVRSPGPAEVRCSFPKPLVDCRMRVSEHGSFKHIDKVLDFSCGGASATVTLDNRATASYAGSGLAAKECGVSLQSVSEDRLTFLVECFGRSEGDGWDRGMALVTSTKWPPLSVTVPTPRLIVAALGTDVSVLLKSTGALTVCHIATPAEKEVDLSPNKAIPSGSRYRQHGSGLAQGECGATLANLTARDAGVWWSRADQSNPEARQATVVLVKSAPVGKPVLHVHNVTRLHIGDLLEATCHAPPGVPPPTLTWLLDGKEVRRGSNNDTLPGDVGKFFPWEAQGVVQTFSRQFSSQDLGKRLECRVRHSDGEDRVFQLLPALPIATAESPFIRSAVAHQTQMACIVNAMPAATVQWRRAGVPVTPSSLVVIGNEGNRHWLLLEDTSRADLTDFTCSASNEVGSASQVIRVSDLPGIPVWKEGTSSPQLAWNVVTIAELTSCTLKVRLGKHPWQEIEVVDSASRINKTLVLVQHGLQKTVAGTYSAFLIARNEHGESPPSSIRVFAMEATVPTSLPNEPTSPPSEPTSTPSEPTSTPSEPTSPPSEPTSTPSGPISLPSKPTSSPVPTPPSAGCPALATNSTHAICTLAEKQVNCSSTPVPLGSTARLECRDGYKPLDNLPEQLTTRCTERGWRPEPFACILDCGRRIDRVRPLTVGSQEALVSEFPWHVGVFQLDLSNSTYEFICSGSLVSPKFFVSAVHCFWDFEAGKTLDETRYKAVVGKHTLAWTTVDEHEQRLDVAAIHQAMGFNNYSKRFEADIAVVELASSVEITDAVNVVCVDWHSPSVQEDRFLVNLMATVPGWSVTENNSLSPTLRYVDLPLVQYEDCSGSVAYHYQDVNDGDKICAGFNDRLINTCPSDAGGGFVFPEREDIGQRYYLRGVDGKAPDPKLVHRCSAAHRSLFTRVSIYIEWIKGIVFTAGDKEFSFLNLLAHVVRRCKV